MNRVGFNDRNSYNRDKYGFKFSVYSYSLMGDVMRLRNMEFLIRRENLEYLMKLKEKKEKIEIVFLFGFEDTNQFVRGFFRRSFFLDLLENIRYQFGSKVCDFLFSDEKVVEKIM